MPTILRQFPFFETHTTALAPGGSVTVRPYQIVVWVSLHPMGRPDLPPDAPRFPAILDSGHSHNFRTPDIRLCLCERLMGLNGQLKAKASTGKFSVQGVELSAQCFNGFGAVRRGLGCQFHIEFLLSDFDASC